MSETYVALLRGINVGGKNKLSMESLRECFADAGCSNIRTYIQSGNVVFHAGDVESAAAACRHVEAAIFERFSCKSPIVLRSGADLVASSRGNPFSAQGGASDTNALHVVFLADEPEPSRAAMLDHQHSPGDEFQRIGREIYLRLPRGVAGTKLLISYFDSKLKTIGTQRNWRTVLKLAEMAVELGLGVTPNEALQQ